MTSSSKKAIITIGVLAVAVAAALLLFPGGKGGNEPSETDKLLQEKQDSIEKLKLQNEQLQLANQYEQLNSEFELSEQQMKNVENDSLRQKYDAAQARVKELLAELKSERAVSAQRIKELQDEIVTLKGIMRHYVEVIDSLGRENERLRIDNTEMRSQNEKLSNRVDEVSAKNERLNERMTLAEKLNITGLSLTPLKGNGKQEKKVTKAKQLMVKFTITQNNSTPVGEKTIYLRLTGPEGTLLGQRGSFS
ncbi:MAG: hypothetical protein IK092_06240, partial [Muribaculaceae bacterium]|nr:hypothetical protein [Muribaculaceae bacterium]